MRGMHGAHVDGLESGLLGFGKKDREHKEVTRAFEKKEMKRKEAAAAADAEVEALERKIKMAELQKRAAEVGISVPGAPAPAPAAPTTSEGFVFVGYLR